MILELVIGFHRKPINYTSHDIQDELLKAMALTLWQKITASLVETKEFLHNV